MALTPSNVKFDNNTLHRGKSIGHPTAKKSTGNLQCAGLHLNDKIRVVSSDSKVTWDGVIDSISGLILKFTVSNTKNDREPTHGLPADTPTDDVTVTVTSPTDTGTTAVNTVNVDEIP